MQLGNIIALRIDDVSVQFVRIYLATPNSRKWLISNPLRVNFGLFVRLLVL